MFQFKNESPMRLKDIELLDFGYHRGKADVIAAGNIKRRSFDKAFCAARDLKFSSLKKSRIVEILTEKHESWKVTNSITC